MASSASLIEDVSPYTIRISSRHLTLTGTKLSLARLPHEHPLRPSSPSTSSSSVAEERLNREEWARGIPKRELEPLLDHWIEEYDFESVQRRLNESLPQFRVSLRVPGSNGEKARVHYVHMMEEEDEPGVPLLYIPSWPAGFSELEPLIPYLYPEDARGKIPFSIVCPSWPGIGGGFSDSLPFQASSTQAYFTLLATLWDTLMIRLGYESYIACGGGEWAFPVLEALSKAPQSGCRAVHFSKVVLQAPTFRDNPSLWLHWKSASLLSVFRPKSETLGYSPVDLSRKPEKCRLLPSLGSSEHPQTLSYALTDSPVGMLALVRAYLQRYAPQFSTTRFLIEGGKERSQFFLSKSEIVTLALLAWLPGSEGVLHIAKIVGDEEEDKRKKLQKKVRPLVGVSDYNHTLGVPIEWAPMLGNVVFKRRHTSREILRHYRRMAIDDSESEQDLDESKGWEERKDVSSPPASRPPPSPLLPPPTLPLTYTGSTSTLSLDSKGRMPPINEEPEPGPEPELKLHPKDVPEIELMDLQASASPLSPNSASNPFIIKRKPLPSTSSLLSVGGSRPTSLTSSASAPNLSAILGMPSGSTDTSNSGTSGSLSGSTRPRSYSYSYAQSPPHLAISPPVSQIQTQPRIEIPPAHRSSLISGDADEISLTCSTLSTSSSQERREQRRDSAILAKDDKEPNSSKINKKKSNRSSSAGPSEQEKKMPRHSYPAFQFPALYVKDLRSFARVVLEKGVLDAAYAGSISHKKNRPIPHDSVRGVREIEQLREVLVGPS